MLTAAMRVAHVQVAAHRRGLLFQVNWLAELVVVDHFAPRDCSCANSLLQQLRAFHRLSLLIYHRPGQGWLFKMDLQRFGTGFGIEVGMVFAPGIGRLLRSKAAAVTVTNVPICDQAASQQIFRRHRL